MKAASETQLTYEDLFGEDNYELINRESGQVKDTGCIWANFSSDLD